MNNANAYQCSHWSSGWFTYWNYWLPFSLGGKFAFTDIRINIAFILAAWLPSIYSAIRPGGFIYDIPGFSLILGAGFIQDPLARYAAWNNMQVTPLLYAQTWFGTPRTPLVVGKNHPF